MKDGVNRVGQFQFFHAQIMLVGLCVLLLIGGAVVYTFVEVEADWRSVNLTLQRYEGVMGQILDRDERSTEVEDRASPPSSESHRPFVNQ